MLGIICLATFSAFASVPSVHAAYASHGEISIYGNNGFTRDNGVVGGSGTKSDPYLIQGWEIIPGYCGICVTNTTTYFVISNVYVHSGWFSHLGGQGIVLQDVSNAVVANSTLQENANQITVTTSYSPGSHSNIAIIGNTISSASTEITASAHGSASLSNITLANNHLSNGGPYGISLTGVANASIRGNILTYTGVYITGNASQLASNTVTLDNLVNGKPLLYRNGSVGTTFSGSSYGELILADGRNLEVAHGNFTDSGPGIEFVHVDGASITGSQFFNTTLSISIVNSANVTVSGNNISSPAQGSLDTIDVSSSSRTRVENNTISAGGGIFALNTNSSIIQGNVMSGTTGIRVSGSNIRIISNQLSNGGEISLGDYSTATNINVTGNVVTGNGLTPSGNSDPVSGSGISAGPYNTYPIIGAVNNITISGNNLSYDGTGIYLVDVTNATITSNNISNNNNQGVTILYQYIQAYAGSNRVYHNNFINNGGGQGEGYATWDNGYPSGGNYWSDYTGIDNCSGFYQNICPSPDGIGDTIRLVAGGAYDDYPLMKPYGPPDTAKPIWTSGAKLSFSGVSKTQISLKWPPAIDDTWVQSYRIYQDGTLLTTLTGGTTTYLVFSLTPGTTYSFTVEAGDAWANWSTQSLSATVSTVSNPPMGPPTTTTTGSQQLGILQQYWYFIGPAAIACATLLAFLVIRRRSNRKAPTG